MALPGGTSPPLYLGKSYSPLLRDPFSMNAWRTVTLSPHTSNSLAVLLGWGQALLPKGLRTQGTIFSGH